MTSKPPKIAVVGSINMDLVIGCAVLPHPGQTILAESSAEVCGGKGANQAVAAARAGGDVSMIGRIGDDAFATRLRDNLLHANINCDHLQRTEACPSGLAVVAVEHSGQNAILVVPGANGRVSIEDIRSARELIAASDVLLVQLEIPLASVLAAIRIARDAGVRVILDPAPAPTDWPAELLEVDVLCPNESEASALVGDPVHDLTQAESAARKLHHGGAKNVAITLGAAGTLLFDGKSYIHVAPFPITPSDTTAAGDAFAGALAVCWSETNDLLAAVQFANAAGALAASRPDAQPSIATRQEITQLLATRRS